MARSPFRYAGGKAASLPVILPALPPKIGTYYEPFAGGAAVFWALAAERRFRHAILSDVNATLIETYKVIRSDVESLIEGLRPLQRFASAYDVDHYNELRASAPAFALDRAVRFIYLNRTCFNGLHRENKAGQNNVPMDRSENRRSKPPVDVVREELLRECSETLQGVELLCADFALAVGKAVRADAAYFDPPYFPLDVTSFTKYTGAGFNGLAHARLRDVFETLRGRGVAVLASNSDCPASRELYSAYDIQTVQVRRSINSKGGARQAVAEVLISGRPPRKETSMSDTSSNGASGAPPNIPLPSPLSATGVMPPLASAPGVAALAAADPLPQVLPAVSVVTPLVSPPAAAAVVAPAKAPAKGRKKKTAATVAPPVTVTAGAPLPAGGAAVAIGGGDATPVLAAPTGPETCPANESPIGWLETNIKGLERLGRIPLSRKNALIGLTQSGKSGIIEGVILALTGTHPRFGSTPAALRHLAPPGAPDLYARIGGGWLGENDTKLVLHADGSASKPKMSLSQRMLGLSEGDRVRLISSLEADWLEDGAKVTRETVLRRYGSPMQLPDLANAVDGFGNPNAALRMHAPVWSDAFAGAGAGTATPEQLTAASAKLRSLAVGASAVVKAAEASLAEAKAKHATMLLGQENRPALQLIVDQHKRYMNSARARGEGARTAEALALAEADLNKIRSLEGPTQAQVATHNAEVQRCVAAVEQYRAHRVILLKDQEAALLKTSRIRGVDGMLELMASSGSTKCLVPTCTGDVPDAAEARRQLAAIGAERKAQVDAATLALGECDRAINAWIAAGQTATNAAQQLVAGYTQQLQQAEAAVAHHRQMAQSVANVLAGAETAPDPGQVAQATQLLQQFAEADVQAKVVQSAEQTLHAAVARQESVHWCQATVSTLLQTALAHVANRAVAEVDAGQADGFTAVLFLDETTCEWGALDRNQRPHPKDGLSGAERATLAWARVTAQIRGTPCAIIPIDDETIGKFHADPAALARFLAKVDAMVDANAVHMVLVAGLRLEEVPAGWTVTKA